MAPGHAQPGRRRRIEISETDAARTRPNAWRTLATATSYCHRDAAARNVGGRRDRETMDSDGGNSPYSHGNGMEELLHAMVAPRVNTGLLTPKEQHITVSQNKCDGSTTAQGAKRNKCDGRRRFHDSAKVSNEPVSRACTHALRVASVLSSIVVKADVGWADQRCSERTSVAECGLHPAILLHQ